MWYANMATISLYEASRLIDTINDLLSKNNRRMAEIIENHLNKNKKIYIYIRYKQSKENIINRNVRKIILIFRKPLKV